MRPRRIDSNQPEVVKVLRFFGWRVAITSSLGDGFPDLVVSRHGFTALVEVKDGEKVPSARKLTRKEEKFKADWDGVLIEALSGYDAHRQLDLAYKYAKGGT